MMKYALIIAACLFGTACGDKLNEGNNPIQFDIKICPGAIQGVSYAEGETSATAAADCDLDKEGLTILSGQINPSRAYHSDDSDAPRDEYRDMALWNKIGNTVRLYIWKGSPGLSCFNSEYIDVENSGNYDEMEGFHPAHGTMATIFEDEVIIIRACIYDSARYSNQTQTCSKDQRFVMNDRQ